MKTQPDTSEQAARGGSIRSWVGFVVAFGLSILVLRWWGEHIVVRAILGSCWGGYAFYSLGGPDLIRWIIEARNRKQSGAK